MKTKTEKFTPLRFKKPSSLLQCALDDLKKVERDRKKYHVDMSLFHQPDGKVCSVCLAGAVLVKSCNWDHDRDFDDSYSKIDDRLDAQCIAIDCLRVGDILCAFNTLAIP